MQLHYRILPTGAGFAGYVASGAGLKRTYLPAISTAELLGQIARDEPAAKQDEDLLEVLAQDLQQFFAGEAVLFEVPLDTSDAPAFHQQVWTRCRQIPYGETMSYQALAAAVGSPRAARAVGNAMRSNRMPLVVPCHRVLHAGGGLGGYSGPGGTSFKRTLLDMEAATAARV